MSTLRVAMEFRPPTRDDAEAIVAMLIACDIADVGAPDYDIDGLLGEWNEPGVDLTQDGFVTEGAYGLVLGDFGRAWVHPAHRGRGIGTALATRVEQRARERGLPHLHQNIGHLNHTGQALLRSRGYELVDRYLDLSLPREAVATLNTDGARLYDPARDERAMQDLLERSYHGIAHRLLPLEIVLDANPHIETWAVADGPDGGLVGALRAELRPAGFISGAITQLAVDASARRQGVGKALVGVAARALLDHGASYLRASPRESSTGAVAFLRALGFAGDWWMEQLRLDLAARP